MGLLYCCGISTLTRCLGSRCCCWVTHSCFILSMVADRAGGSPCTPLYGSANGTNGHTCQAPRCSSLDHYTTTTPPPYKHTHTHTHTHTHITNTGYRWLGGVVVWLPNFGGRGFESQARVLKGLAISTTFCVHVSL